MIKTGTLLTAAALTLGLALLASGCGSKPSEELCQRAVENIRKLTGGAHTDVGADPKAAVRSCRAQSDSETVECMAEARTTQELYGCGGEMAETLKAMDQKKVDFEKKQQAEQKTAPGGAAAVDAGSK